MIHHDVFYKIYACTMNTLQCNEYLSSGNSLLEAITKFQTYYMDMDIIRVTATHFYTVIT